MAQEGSETIVMVTTCDILDRTEGLALGRRRPWVIRAPSRDQPRSNITQAKLVIV